MFRTLPTVRPDLVIRPLGDRGRFVVKDPRSGAYFQIGPQEEYLLTRLDGRQSTVALCRGFEQAFGEPLTDDDLGEFLAMADAQQFVTPAPPPPPPSDELNAATAALLGLTPAPARPLRPVEQPPAPSPAPLPPPAVEAVPAPSPAPAPAKAAPGGQSLLYWRKSLFNPDKLFGALVPWVGFVWTRGFVAVSVLAVLLAGWVVVSGWADLLSGFGGALRWESAVLVWVLLLAATTLHEFAHGLTLKRYGGQVPELGVLVMFFLPCLFCNVSDAWLLREKKKRLLVTLAGGYCDLCLWAAAVFVWRLTPPDGVVNYLAFVALTVLGGRVFFNFNPFLKLDGYYLLGDLLEVPNLLTAGQERAKAHLRRVLWGAPPPPPAPRGRVLTAFGLASWVYGLGFLGIAVYGLLRGLWGWLGPAGLAAAAGLAVVLVKGQFAGLFGGQVKAMLAGRKVRTAVWLLALLAAAGGLAFVPIGDRAGGTFRVRGGGRWELRAPAVAVLKEVLYDEGDEVPAGAVVARLEVPDLASRRTRQKAAAAEARAKLALLEAGPNPAAVTDSTERVGRAKAWHERAKGDLEREREAHLKELARREAVVAQAAAEVRQTAAAVARMDDARGSVPAAEYDAAAAKAAVARALLAQAKAEQAGVTVQGVAAAETELARRAKELADAAGTLALLKAGPRAEEVAAAKAGVDRADEEARYLDELADRLTVRAVRGGVMTTPRLRERVGRTFQEGELIGEVEDASALEIELLLKEGQAGRVEVGQEVEVLPRAMPFQTLKGRVARVAPAARRPGDRGDGPPAMPAAPAPPAAADAEGLMAVYCTLDAGEPGLRSGMTGFARVSRGDRPAWMVLSESALRTVRIEFWK